MSTLSFNRGKYGHLFKNITFLPSLEPEMWLNLQITLCQHLSMLKLQNQVTIVTV